MGSGKDDFLVRLAGGQVRGHCVLSCLHQTPFVPISYDHPVACEVSEIQDAPLSFSFAHFNRTSFQCRRIGCHLFVNSCRITAVQQDTSSSGEMTLPASASGHWCNAPLCQEKIPAAGRRSNTASLFPSSIPYNYGSFGLSFSSQCPWVDMKMSLPDIDSGLNSLGVAFHSCQLFPLALGVIRQKTSGGVGFDRKPLSSSPSCPTSPRRVLDKCPGLLALAKRRCLERHPTTLAKHFPGPRCSTCKCGCALCQSGYSVCQVLST